MAVETTVGFFHVESEESAAHIERLCSQYARARTSAAFTVQHELRRYELTNAAWNANDKALVGTLWRVREAELPSKLKSGSVSSLGIAADEDLGEATSFAYMPSKAVAVVQYNHNGPRHSVVREILYNAGVSAPLVMSPVLKSDALKRMQKAKLVRRVEFALAKPSQDELAALRQVGGAVSDALDAMEDLGGMTVRVTISMGHNRGGLSERAKTFFEAMSHGGSPIQALKANIKESDEHATEMVDLLGGRRTITLEIPEKNREVDHAECRKRLLRSLRSFKL